MICEAWGFRARLVEGDRGAWSPSPDPPTSPRPELLLSPAGPGLAELLCSVCRLLGLQTPRPQSSQPPISPPQTPCLSVALRAGRCHTQQALPGADSAEPSWEPRSIEADHRGVPEQTPLGLEVRTAVLQGLLPNTYCTCAECSPAQLTSSPSNSPARWALRPHWLQLRKQTQSWCELSFEWSPTFNPWPHWTPHSPLRWVLSLSLRCRPGNGVPARTWASLDSSRLSPEPILALVTIVPCCLALRLTASHWRSQT